MKKKFLIIGLTMCGFAFSQDNTCVATTSKEKSCKIKVNINITNLCTWHHPDSININRCTGTSKSTKLRCKVKTLSESGLCHHHDAN